MHCAKLDFVKNYQGLFKINEGEYFIVSKIYLSSEAFKLSAKI
jgi:hypothetical protein